jgi:hypothetical protein
MVNISDDRVSIRRAYLVLGGVVLVGIAVFGALWYARAPAPAPVTSNEIQMKAYTTAYTYWDNTPPGSADIAYPASEGFPTVHEKAGGTGTYEDPITLAVGHVIASTPTTTIDAPDFPVGTRFYLPNVRRYFIVEDLCGDGDTPQDIPCHKLNEEATSTGATVWVDLWIDGSDGAPEAVDACASDLTEAHLMIENPLPTYVVVPGSLFSQGGCSEQFGDMPVQK